MQILTTLNDNASCNRQARDPIRHNFAGASHFIRTQTLILQGFAGQLAYSPAQQTFSIGVR